MREGRDVNLVVVTWDPGETTGWAIHRVSAKVLLEEGQVGSVSHMKWASGQFNEGSTSGNVDRLLDLARTAYQEIAIDGDLFAMVGESFHLRLMSAEASLLEPVRFNAVISDRLRGKGTFVDWQTPSDAMRTINDQRLRLWGLYRPGMVHARDAQRHGLLFFRRFYSDPEVRSRLGWV